MKSFIERERKKNIYKALPAMKKYIKIVFNLISKCFNYYPAVFNSAKYLKLMELTAMSFLYC